MPEPDKNQQTPFSDTFTAVIGKLQSAGVLPQDSTPDEEQEALGALYDRAGASPEIKQKQLARAYKEREPVHRWRMEQAEQARISQQYGPEAEQRFIGEMAMQRGAYGLPTQGLNWLGNRLNTVAEGIESAAGGISGAIGLSDASKAMRERITGLRAVRGANLPENAATRYSDVAAGFVPYVAGGLRTTIPLLFGSGASRVQEAGYTGAWDSAKAGATESGVGLVGGQIAGKVLGSAFGALAPRTLAPAAQTAGQGAGFSLGMTTGQSLAGKAVGDQELASEPWSRVGSDAGLMALVSLLTHGRAAYKQRAEEARLSQSRIGEPTGEVIPPFRPEVIPAVGELPPVMSPDLPAQGPIRSIGPSVVPENVLPQVPSPSLATEAPVPAAGISVRGRLGPELPAYEPAPTLEGTPIRSIGPSIVPDATLPPVIENISGGGLSKIADIAPIEVPAARRAPFEPATQPELPPVMLEGDLPPVARTLGPIIPEGSPSVPEAGPKRLPRILPTVPTEAPVVPPKTPKTRTAKLSEAESAVVQELPAIPEVPRAAETAPEATRSAEPIPEVRPSADLGAAPKVEATPVEAPAAPAPAFRAGDTVNVLAPDGKVASKGMRVLGVNEETGTVQVLNRSTGKPQELPIARVEPVQKPVGELPAKAMEEKPMSMGPQRHRARSGAIPVGGNRFTGELPGERAVKSVGRGALTLTKGAKELASSMFSLRSANDKLLKANLPEQAEVFKRIEGEQQDIKMSERANAIRSKANIGATEVREHKRLIEPDAPASGTGIAYNRMDDLITGRAEPQTPFERRAVEAAREANRYTGDAARGVKGMHTGDPTGKTSLWFYTDEGLNLFADFKNPALKKFIELVAKDNNKTPQDIERIFNEAAQLRESGDGMVIQNALEHSREIKRMPTDFWYNDAHYRIRDNSMNAYANRTINGAAARIPIVRHIGPNMDPSASKLPTGASLLPKDATPEQVNALREAIRAAHGIGTDQGMLSKIASTTASEAPALKQVYDVAKRVTQLVSKPVAGAALSFSEASAVLGLPVMAGNVGARNLFKGLIEAARDPAGRKLAKEGQLQQMVVELGGKGYAEQAANLLSQLGIKGRAADFGISQALAHAALMHTRNMQNGIGNKTNHTAMLMELGYGEKMAARMAEGKGTEAEYRQAARDMVQQATGHGRSDLSAPRMERSAILRSLLPFTRFPNARLQQMFRQYHVATTAKDPGVRNAAGLNLAKSMGANITGGASIALGMAFVAAGASGVKQLLQNPEELAFETWWRGLVGPAQTWMGKLFGGPNQSAAETIAKFSLPAGAAIDTAKKTIEAFETKSWDPIKELFFLRTTGAKYGRDALSWATEIDPAVTPAARRKAISLFYKFAKDNPELLDSPIAEGYQVEMTPFTAALRKLPKGQYGNPNALADVLMEARIIGKDDKDIAAAINRKRLMPRFKEKYQRYAAALLHQSIGDEAFKEIMQHDMIVDALARRFK